MEELNVLLRILSEKFQIPQQLLVEENYNKPLTGDLFLLNGRDLVYLFMELEKQLKIRIDAKKITDYQFNTIHGILKLLS